MTKSSDRDREIPPSGAVREHSKGKIDNRPPEQYHHAGLVRDDEILRLLNSIAQHYNPEKAAEYVGSEPENMPTTYEETRLYREIVGRQSTHVLTEAIHQGDDATMSYFSGVPDMRSDISGLSAISTLDNEMLHEAPIVYIFGPPGSGKTNFALLLAERWGQYYNNSDVASNIRTWQEADKWIPRWPVLKDWINEQTEELDEGGITQKENANKRLFVFDEASSHAAGHGKEGYETRQKLVKMLYKIRKANAGLIIIGHDGKDVHPAIRAMATIVERRRGEFKQATLYEDVVEREGRRRIVELNGVPETSYTYDDKEATSWSWEISEKEQNEKQKEIKKLAEKMTEKEIRKFAAAMASDDNINLSYSEIGRIVGKSYRGKPFDQSWVSKWKQKLANGKNA